MTQPVQLPSPQPASNSSPDVPQMIDELQAATKDIERSYAGYACLFSALQGQRGLPIFRYPAMVNSVNNQIEVASDLKDIDPADIPNVLHPLINAHATRLLKAVQRGQRILADLDGALRRPAPAQS
ncbi:MAG: hypothetical protein L0312_16250 [Acidobacteria bacterium]|nr:hypothetical protein [Acidobacteriota bacterium]